MRIIWTSKYKTYSLRSSLGLAIASSIFALVLLLGFFSGSIYFKTTTANSQLTPIITEDAKEDKIINLDNQQNIAVEDAIQSESATLQIKALTNILAELEAKLVTLQKLQQEVSPLQNTNKFNITSKDIEHTSDSYKFTGMGGVYEPIEESKLQKKLLPELLTHSNQKLNQALNLESKYLSSQYQTIHKQNDEYFLPSVLPADSRISSQFGTRVDPFNFTMAMHKGVDFAGPVGTPIYAVASGIVTLVKLGGDYGNHLEITHNNNTTSFYAHNSKIAVRKGEFVQKGQLVSYMGATGRASGPHLHLEIRENGVAINPKQYLDYDNYLAKY